MPVFEEPFEASDGSKCTRICMPEPLAGIEIFFATYLILVMDWSFDPPKEVFHQSFDLFTDQEAIKKNMKIFFGDQK